MSIKNFEIELSFSTPLAMVECAQLFCHDLSKRLVMPDSAEFFLLSAHPETSRPYHKALSSIDGEIEWGNQWNLPTMDGEILNKPVEGLSVLSKPEKPCVDNAEIASQLTILDEHLRGGNEYINPHFTFWGRSKIAYANDAGGISHGWVLREYLSYAQAWQPLIHVTFLYVRNPRDRVLVALRTAAFAWSFSSSKYDNGAGVWQVKRNLQAARASAGIIAESLKETCIVCEANDTECELCIEGRPDISGSLRSELEAKFPKIKAT